MFAENISSLQIRENAAIGQQLLERIKFVSDKGSLAPVVNNIHALFTRLENKMHDLEIQSVEFYDQHKLINLFTSGSTQDHNILQFKKEDFLEIVDGKIVEDKINKHFVIHAEISAYIFKSFNAGQGDIIGISKLCCFLCGSFLTFANEPIAGSHNIYFYQSLEKIIKVERKDDFDNALSDLINQGLFFYRANSTSNTTMDDIQASFNHLGYIFSHLKPELNEAEFISKAKQYGSLGNEEKQKFLKDNLGAEFDVSKLPKEGNRKDRAVLDLWEKVAFLIGKKDMFAMGNLAQLIQNIQDNNLILELDESNMKQYENIDSKQEHNILSESSHDFDYDNQQSNVLGASD
jgi:hypothetical protein